MDSTINSGGLPALIEPANRAAGGDLELRGDKDRNRKPRAQRRRHQKEFNLDADEFAHAEPNQEPEE